MVIVESHEQRHEDFITLTERALQHFQNLLSKEDPPGMNLRIYVSNPGTAQADIGVTFCPPGEEEDSDLKIPFKGFTLFVDKQSESALEKTSIDFEGDEITGQLSVKAPYLRGREPDIGSSLEERVQYVLEAEINPSLSAHGGRVSLVCIEGNVVVLRFGGGCHGCGMVNVTLKHGIEKTLKEKFPEIVEIRDVTDHATGENPYY